VTRVTTIERERTMNDELIDLAIRASFTSLQNVLDEHNETEKYLKKIGEEIQEQKRRTDKARDEFYAERMNAEQEDNSKV
jgi:hypothetical protein